jgi:hypothetical protein
MNAKRLVVPFAGGLTLDKESIRRATGMTDEALLDRFAELHLNGELMAAFQLYPLVEIAWSDGSLDENEAQAVLRAAVQHGLQRGTRTYAMLGERLRKGPDPSARKIWFLYAAELEKVLSPSELESFRKDLVEFARGVAVSSGGILNLAFNVSGVERRMLAEIEKALTP